MKQNAFTLVELLTIIVIIGILMVIAVPKFINMRADAINAAAQANLAALRSVVSAYYSNSAVNNSVCTTANPYRTSNAPGWNNGTPCYPASVAELESLLSAKTSWSDANGGGFCYDSAAGSSYDCPK